jgi:BMFP domain-containing protein YqiC
MPLQSAQPVQLKASKSNAIPVATGQFATSARAAAAATRHLQTHSAPKQATAPIAQRYAKSVAESLSQPAVPNVKTQPAQSSRLVDSDGESRLARAHASLDADFAAALQSVRSQLDKSRHDLSQRLSQLTVGKRSASSIQDDDERMDQMFEEAEKALSHANSVADAALQTSARLKTLHAQSEQLEADSATAINSAPSSPSHASAFTSVSNATSPAHVQHKTQLSSSNLFGDHKAQSLTHRPVATISEAVVGSNDFEAIHDDIGTELDRIRPPYANRMLSNSSIASTDASSSDEATSRSANAFASNCKPSQNDEQKIVKSISRGTSHLSIVLPTEPAAAPLPSPGIDMSKHIPEPAPPAGFGVPAAIAALRQVHMTPMSPKSASALVFLRASSPAHLAASMTPHRRSTSPAGFGIMRPPSPYAGASPLAKRY